MSTERPDLSSVPLEVLSYIQSLEAELETLRAAQAARVLRPGSRAQPRRWLDRGG
jgi:hypothetical protein